MAKTFFNEINHDSYKNRFFITQDHFGQITIINFRNKLQNKLSKMFSSKKNKGKIKCIEEFTEELFKCGFLENKTADEAFNKFMELNNLYFDNLYQPCIDQEVLDNKLYKIEIKSILENDICFVTKNNNFIDFIKDQNIKPRHTWKKGKKRITKGLKQKVWFKEFGHVNKGICSINHCNKEIFKIDFEAGHVTSEMNNGPTELSNLRPICKDCNRQMSSKNWNEWDECQR